MFILPGLSVSVSHPLADLAPQSSSLLTSGHYAYPLVAALVVVLVLRAAYVVLGALLARRHPKAARLVQEKSIALEAPPSPTTPVKETTRWFSPSFFKWETLPSVTLAEALPITLHPPPPPAMRGRYVYRGGRGVGFVKPREQQKAPSTVDTPLPAIYASQPPVCMAKMIMSRHTFRRPASPSPSASAPRRAPSIQSFRPPSGSEH